MSFQNDSNDSIFFIWCGEGVFFFSFYKLTSYPFFTISSPVPIDGLSFFLFIYSISSVHAHLFMFYHLFLSLSSSYIICLCLHLLCLMTIVHYVCVRVLTTCLVFVYSFSFLISVCFHFMGAVKIGPKRMIQHVPSFSNACVYF